MGNSNAQIFLDSDYRRLSAVGDRAFWLSLHSPSGFKVTVVDVDLRNNDLIGVGHCRQNDTCEVGQAIVTLDRARK